MNNIKRKLRKLKRDPKLFFKDMIDKKKSKLNNLIYRRNYTPRNKFTIISAVYNVEKYLDDYFKSIVKQSVNFVEFIQIVLVDDGSTDNSKSIIEKWQKRYPKNIHYYYKENGGQASARNHGIPYAKTKWITFIDPDDFISRKYFQKVDKFISDNENVSLVSCPFIFYFEDKKIYKNSHPLKFRFDEGEHKCKIKELDRHFQMSVNNAFFRTNLIKRFNITFSDIKPNFEDAKFVGDYLTHASQENTIGFIQDANYFYRKRSDGTSTLDGAWQKNTLYTKVLHEGCLKLFENCQSNLGFVPVYIQRTVLYHLSWYFKYLVNNESALNILSKEEKTEFISLLYKIFKFIDVKTIMDFELVGTWFFQRVLYICHFKKMKIPFHIVYIDSIDREKEQFNLYSFSNEDTPNEEISWNGSLIKPQYEKSRIYTLAGETILYEHRFWISYKDRKPKDMFRLKIDGKDARISLTGKQHLNGLPLRVIFRDLEPQIYTQTDHSWIIMDRDTQADDNGEHFYRYMQKNHPEKRIYFALNKDSHDWKRLEKDNFNLINFKSEQYRSQLKLSSHLISSHLDEYIINPFKDNFEFTKKFIFLQHGITHNDLSSWINSKRNLSLIISATPYEHEAFIANNTKYKLTQKEVSLVGFPRHDALVKGNNTKSKSILIMPTWRKSILGNTTNGNKRELNNSFMETEYAKHWRSFLCSNELRSLSKKYGYQVIFAPHANIEPYLTKLNLPDYIKLWRAKDGSIQTLFQNSTFMITDYSSVAFEMGVLGKTVLYYQFDQEDFFTNAHVFQRGYFSYEKHGFGPVVYQEKDLVLSLKRILKNKGKPFYPYNKRIKRTFPFIDGECCARTYEAIKKLEE
ncbi:hypothetical protein BKK54_00245 [Rodentibacter genomosp. 1]|uniref:Glycosyltransferase 2-like domain-containing protein n=1 Tax=Rodentibacter genomosp. 1 TaxID=1908264 RepID=A0A1V3J9G6_9PAST|nr:CDP-glycerol glycerophosphotransferase family protein [Rodentibacter genomosp. 1]OOF52087.1 hypothetical protein BKK54_00245 [Rodentibacter genomosp. 1]